MPTAQQIENGASSFNQLANKLDAILFLLNTLNMTAQQISTGAAAFNQLPNKLDCIIYLLSVNGGGSAGVTTGAVDPSGATTTGSLYLNTVTDVLWVYNGGWIAIV
jgi:hypothetical protein